MKEAPIPENELERIAAVYKLHLLDTSAEDKFDRLTKAATQIFHVPISTLTIIDTNREWFKSCQGLLATEGERAISFCGHALVEDEILVIPDTLQDERFSDNPMVVGKPFIRFYAGVPIMSVDNKRIGVFCIKDTKPRQFSKHDEEILEGLAAWAELEINLRDKHLSESERQMILNKYKWKQDKIFISKHKT